MLSNIMGSHPINLALRFSLEMAALVAVGLFGWHLPAGALAWVGAALLPLAFMALWGTFAVPDDPSRSGRAPVPIHGSTRLALEAGLFGSAVVAVAALGHPLLATVFAGLLVLHYVASWDRLAWLVRR